MNWAKKISDYIDLIFFGHDEHYKVKKLKVILSLAMRYGYCAHKEGLSLKQTEIKFKECMNDGREKKI